MKGRDQRRRSYAAKRCIPSLIAILAFSGIAEAACRTDQENCSGWADFRGVRLDGPECYSIRYADGRPVTSFCLATREVRHIEGLRTGDQYCSIAAPFVPPPSMCHLNYIFVN